MMHRSYYNTIHNTIQGDDAEMKDGKQGLAGKPGRYSKKI